MKRILSLLLILATLSAVFCACGEDKGEREYDTPPEGFTTGGGNNDPETVTTDYDIPVTEGLDYDYDDLTAYITLPDYMSDSFVFSKLPVDDSGIESAIEYLKMYSPSAKLTDIDNAATDGNYVLFDYVAKSEKKENVLSGSDVALIIGKDLFAPGFDGFIKGAKKDQELIFSFTFPKGWTNVAGVEGMTLSFEVTVKAVKDAKLPELSTVIKEQGAANEAELRDLIVQDRESTNASALFEAVVAQSTVTEYPDKELQIYREIFQKNDEARAEMYGVTLDSLINTEYNGSKSDYEKAKTEYAREKCKRDLVAYWLQDKYSFELTKKEYNAILNEYFESEGAEMGFKSVEEAHENMGQALATAAFSDLAAKSAYADKYSY